MPNLFRLSGLFYVIIILCGVSAELVFLGPRIVAGDGAATQALVTAQMSAFRLGIAATMVMVLADIALAVTLFAVFAHHNAALAMLSLVTRLVQAAMIGAALMPLVVITRIVQAPMGADWVLALYDVYGLGYDLALLPFALSCVALAALFWTSRIGPRWIAIGLGASAAVYTGGSALALLAPALGPVFAPAYLVPLVAETALALWLLVGRPNLPML